MTSGPLTASPGGIGVTGSAGGNVFNGADGGGGGGGGEGGGGSLITGAGSSTSNVTVSAGAGANGGAGGTSNNTGNGGNGGNGGAGGAGAVLTGGGTLTISSGSISGAGGGSGGHGGGTNNGGNGGNGGNGAAGGVGVLLTAGGTLTNSGSIQAGNGGAGGGGGTTNNGGILGIGGTAGSGGVGITGAGVAIVNSGSIAGGIGNNGAGAQANAITFTGGTNSLTLQTGSNITGNVVAFSTADTFALGGTTNSTLDVSAIGGAAQYQGFGVFQKVGGSAWTLTNTTTAVTPWTISAGTLSISSDSNLGNSSGGLTFKGGTLETTATLSSARGVALDTSGTIQVDTGVATLSGVIADGASAGSLTKTGAGTLTLAGTNTYTGATTINGGTLNITGALSGSTNVTVNNGGTLNVTGSVSDPTVNAGGLLTGTGMVGATTINAGGIFTPGTASTPGTSMTVAGSLAFASGALYVVSLNPSTASFAAVTGLATLGGASVSAMFASGTYVAKQYTILTAGGGVSGMFGPVMNTNLPSGFRTTLSYDANDAYLNLALNFAAPPGSSLSANQQNVANAIVNFFNSNGTIPLAFGGLTPTGLTQISGEAATGSQQTTFDAMSLFMSLLTDPFVAGRGDNISGGSSATPFAEEIDTANADAAKDPTRSKSERDAYAAIYRKAPVADVFSPSWSVWAAGFGGSQTTNGSAVLGSNNTSSSVYGTAVGADYRFSPNTIAGFALAGGGTNFSVANGGSGRSDLFQAGAFIRHTVGPAYVSAALAYGWQDVTTNRTMTTAGIEQFQARFQANTYSGRIEDGYRFVTPFMGGVGITPYAAGQFTTFDLPAYAEGVVSGAGTFALAYGAKSVTDPRSELGLRSDKSWAMMDGVLTLRARLAWAHDYDPNRSIGATFQALPGASFVVNGAAEASDSALVTAAVEKKWLNGWSAAATFEGEFSDVSRSYAGKGVVRYHW